IIGDALDEADETFSILLAFGASNYTIGVGQGVATIVDDDAPPSIAIRDTSVVEGDADEGPPAQLSVRLSGPSGQTVTVLYHAQSDTAVMGADFVATSGTLSFLPGEVAKTVQVPVKGDTLDELDESFNVFLTEPQNVTF